MRSGKISVLAISAALMAGEPDVGFGSVRASGAAPDSSVLVLAEPSEPGTRLVVAGSHGASGPATGRSRMDRRLAHAPRHISIELKTR